jgi:hypothetical protein
VTIIFGLIVSTVLTLVIVPTVFSLLEEWSNKISGLFNRPKVAEDKAETV